MIVRHKKILAVLLALIVTLNYTSIVVDAAAGDDLQDAIQGADAATLIKYVFTQMGAVVTGSFDDVINNNQKLVDYVNGGLPVTKDSKGNISIGGDVINVIHEELKNNATALDGYYMVEPKSNLSNYFYSMTSGFSPDIYDIWRLRLFGNNPYGAFYYYQFGSDTLYAPKFNTIGFYLSGGNVFGYSYDGGTREFISASFVETGINWFTGSSYKISKNDFISRLVSDTPVKLFYTLSDLKRYDVGDNNVYFRSNFYGYNPNLNNALTFNADSVLSKNWDSVSNQIAGEIKKGITQGMTENDKQTLIDSKADEILGSLGDIGGGVDNVNNNLNSWLSRIYKLLGVVSDNLITSIRELSKMDESLKTLVSNSTLSSGKLSNIFLQMGTIIENVQNISSEFETIFSGFWNNLDLRITALIEAIKDINVSGGGGGVGGLISGAGSLVGSALGGLLGGSIQDFIDGLIPEEALGDAVSSALGSLSTKFQPVAIASKKKFPISLPWDFISVVMLFNAKPEVPRFELPLKLEHYGIDEKVVLDMSEFEKLSKASRAILSATFLLMLILITAKFLKVVNDT